jgi:HEPN domain-containing protein
MARSYISRAKICCWEAEQAIARKDAPGTIRRSQEALELAAKACLRFLGIEYPKEHDVGDALEGIREKLPEGLGMKREGIPPERAFSMEFASQVFSKVSELVRLCEEFVGKGS